MSGRPALGELQPAEHPAGGRGARDGGEPVGDRGGEGACPSRRHRAGAGEVRVEPAGVGEQLGRDRLGERGAAQVGALLEALHGADDGGRPGEPPDPQRRCDDLGRAAEPEHPVAVRGDGPGGCAVEREQAVRVVLDDQEAVAVGQRGQRAAAIGREGDPARVVEARHGVHEAGAQARGEPLGEHVDPHAVGVERHPGEGGARGLEDLQRTDVGGVLDHDGGRRGRAARGRGGRAPVASRW